jgi:hypothetical protein
MKKLTQYPAFAESLSNSNKNCHNCICPEPKKGICKKKKRKIRKLKVIFRKPSKHKLLNKSKGNFFSLKNVLTTKV